MKTAKTQEALKAQKEVFRLSEYLDKQIFEDVTELYRIHFNAPLPAGLTAEQALQLGTDLCRLPVLRHGPVPAAA